MMIVSSSFAASMAAWIDSPGFTIRSACRRAAAEEAAVVAVIEVTSNKDATTMIRARVRRAIERVNMMAPILKWSRFRARRASLCLSPYNGQEGAIGRALVFIRADVEARTDGTDIAIEIGVDAGIDGVID